MEVKRPKSVVAVDIDEVLCDFTGQIILYHNKIYGTSLKYQDFISCKDFLNIYFCLDNFADVWGGNNEQAVHKVHEFFSKYLILCSSFIDSVHFKEIKPIKGAKEVLTKFKNHFEFHCVTSRQHLIQKETEIFINTFYPGLFSEIHFGNHYSKESPNPDEDHHSKRSKPEMCLTIKAIALIDDSMSYAQQCSSSLGSNGFKTCLFGEYPWNQGEVPSFCVRKKSWSEVEDFLESLKIED